MDNNPAVSVGPPDDLGLRKVTVNGKTVGKVQSPKGLQRLLRHEDLAFGHDIQWCGGDSSVWPDRLWLRRLTCALTALGLLATACVLTKIGIVDTFDALTYAGRLAGASFVVAALIEGIAAIAALDYWTMRRTRFSGPVVLVGVSIALAINLLLFLLQITGRPVYMHYLWLRIVLMLWSVWAICTLVRARTWKGIQNPRRIAIGAVVSAGLALTNLTYSQVYVPYAAPMLVESGATFGEPSLKTEGARKMFLPVHLHVKNAGQVPVYVLGSIFWIHGKATDHPNYMLIKTGEFIAPPGRALNPGEEFSSDDLAEIDIPDLEKPPYEAVKAQAEFYVVRKDRMSITGDYELSKAYARRLKEEGKDKDPEGPPGEYYRYQAESSNSNEILNVTRGRQRVTLWWMFKGQYPYLYVDVAPPGERKAFDADHRDANKGVIGRYGLTKVRGSMTQKPFVELLHKAEAQDAH